MAPIIISQAEFAIFKSDFDSLDTNRNGVLDGNEIRALLRKQLGRDPSEEQFKSFMSQADLNADGEISLDEYLDVMLGPNWSVEFRRITQREYNIFRADFDAFDSNGNGVLDGEECIELITKQMGRKPTAAEAKEFMAKADLDNDGNISFEEYLNLVCGPGWKVEVKTITPDEFRLFQSDFNALDKNGNGNLDGDEIHHLLAKQLGRDPTPEQLKAFMSEVDLNSDGCISLEEYLNYVCGSGWKVAPARK